MRRIELLTGIEDKENAQKLLQILQLQCSDNTLSHELVSDGSYHKVKTDPAHVVNNHKMIEDHMSSMQKALKKESPNYVQQLAYRLLKDS